MSKHNLVECELSKIAYLETCTALMRDKNVLINECQLTKIVFLEICKVVTMSKTVQSIACELSKIAWKHAQR